MGYGPDFRERAGYWTKVTSGRKKVFETADDLWNAAVEYFEYVEKNPAIEGKVSFYEGKAAHDYVEKKRPFTIGGLCLFLGISKSTWQSYKNREEFIDVCERIEMVTHEQKFDGAMTGHFNANLTARAIGLAERSELSGPNGGPIQSENVLGEQAAFFTSLLTGLAENLKNKEEGPE